jgi:hypothetical protein
MLLNHGPEVRTTVPVALEQHVRRFLVPRASRLRTVSLMFAPSRHLLTNLRV